MRPVRASVWIKVEWMRPSGPRLSAGPPHRWKAAWNRCGTSKYHPPPGCRRAGFPAFRRRWNSRGPFFAGRQAQLVKQGFAQLLGAVQIELVPDLSINVLQNAVQLGAQAIAELADASASTAKPMRSMSASTRARGSSIVTSRSWPPCSSSLVESTSSKAESAPASGAAAQAKAGAAAYSAASCPAW